MSQPKRSKKKETKPKGAVAKATPPEEEFSFTVDADASPAPENGAGALAPMVKHLLDDHWVQRATFEDKVKLAKQIMHDIGNLTPQALVVMQLALQGGADKIQLQAAFRILEWVIGKPDRKVELHASMGNIIDAEVTHTVQSMSEADILDAYKSQGVDTDLPKPKEEVM